MDGSSVVESKACTKCGTVKPLDAFHPSKHGKNGRASWCRECFNGYKNGRRRNDAGYRDRLNEINRARNAAKSNECRDPNFLKTCRSCGETKAAPEFKADKRSSDGLYCHCKACVSEQARRRYESDSEYRARRIECSRRRHERIASDPVMREAERKRLKPYREKARLERQARASQ